MPELPGIAAYIEALKASMPHSSLRTEIELRRLVSVLRIPVFNPLPLRRSYLPHRAAMSRLPLTTRRISTSAPSAR